MPRKKRPKPPVGAAKFTDAEVIGEGAFGQVYKMRDITTQEMVAAKHIPRGSMVNKYIYREMINHKRLVHRNIIQFREVFLTPTHLAIVMEYAAGGDLLQFVNEYKQRCGTPLPEDYARFFFHQILCGIGYMHAKGFCHRDLKLENILLDADSNSAELPTVKICDFGFSKGRVHSNPHSYVGTTCYCAPEILTAKDQEEAYSGEASDIWSAGVILYLLLCGELPFGPNEKNNYHIICKRVLNGEYTFPEHVPLTENCKELLASILEVEPAKRLGLSAIWDHPWMAGAGYKRAASFEDEGAVSWQSDENITSLCIEAMDQDENGLPIRRAAPSPAGPAPHEAMPAGGGDPGMSSIEFDDDAVFSNIIHMASEVDPAEELLPPGEELPAIASDLMPDVDTDLDVLLPSMSIDDLP